jgi:hypothetical protein
MKPLDQKYIIARKQGIVSIQSIDPITNRVTWLGPSGDGPVRTEGFFDMGYIGAKCLRVAFAILYDFIGADIPAYRLEDAFEYDHVQRWTGASMEIDGATIAGWIEAHQHLIARAALRRQVPERVAPASTDSHHGEPL